MKIYFDNVLLDEDNYMSYDESFNSFQDTFYLGSTASVVVNIQIPISAWPGNVNEVQIYNDAELLHTLYVDDVSIEDDDTVKLKLCDALMRTDIACDFSSLINNEHGITAKELLNFICDSCSIPYSDVVFTNCNVEIHSYDNTLTARQYLSMIGELAGGFIRINNEGYLEIVDYVLSDNSISENDVESYKLGELNTIGRVVYDDGVSVPKQSSDDTSLYTIYLNINNLFLQVITDLQFEAICDKIIGYQFANIKIDTCTSFFTGGSTISFIKEDNTSIPIICNYNKSYFGGYIGSYETNIKSQKMTETQVIPNEDRIRKINTQINQIDGTLTIQSQEISGLHSETAALQVNINNIQSLFQITGGSNLIKNSQFLLTDEYWTFTPKEGSEQSYHTELGQGYNGSLIGQTVSVANIILRDCTTTTNELNITNLKQNVAHTLNYYISQDANTTSKVKLVAKNTDDVVYEDIVTTTLESINMVNKSITFISNDTDYTLSIESSTSEDGYTRIYDLMLNLGDKKSWEPSASEVYSTILKMSQLGMQVYSAGSNILTLITSDGFRVFEATKSGDDLIIGREITWFDIHGLNTDTVSIKKAIIGKYVQTEMTLNGTLHHVEYFQS